MALHSGSDEPDTFTADAEVSGRAVEADAATRQTSAEAVGMPADDEYELFRIDLEQVVLTAVSDAKDALVITSWRPGRGLTKTRRA